MGVEAQTLPVGVEQLDHYRVADLMSGTLLTAYEGWSVKRLAAFFVRHDISAAPVVASDEELVGVVSQSDVVRFESRSPTDDEIQRLIRQYCGPYSAELTPQEVTHLKEKASETCTVNSIMTPQVISVEANEFAGKACATMLEKNIHRLFVTENGRLIGVLTAMDCLRKLVE